jgi:RNA-binding protein
MTEIKGSHRKYLRSIAHSLNPSVMVGKNGVTDTVIESVDKALTAHELIKIRFIERKTEKKEFAAEIEERTKSHIAGMIGHVLILYRQQDDPEKRKIKLPKS